MIDPTFRTHAIQLAISISAKLITGEKRKLTGDRTGDAAVLSCDAVEDLLHGRFVRGLNIGFEIGVAYAIEDRKQTIEGDWKKAILLLLLDLVRTIETVMAQGEARPDLWATLRHIAERFGEPIPAGVGPKV